MTSHEVKVKQILATVYFMLRSWLDFTLFRAWQHGRPGGRLVEIYDRKSIFLINFRNHTMYVVGAMQRDWIVAACAKGTW